MARRRVLTVSGGVVLGTAAPTSRLFATGTTTLRRAGTASWASALFAQPTSVGWLCKEIIKIFRLRRSAGSALKATQAAGNNRNPPLKTFRTGLLPAL